MLREKIKKGKKRFFGDFFINFPVMVLWWESLLSGPTTEFNRKFQLCCPNFLFSFKDRVKTTTDSIKWAFRFILGILEFIVPNFLGVFRITKYRYGCFYCKPSCVVFFFSLSEAWEMSIQKSVYQGECIVLEKYS